jgi:hypothetical protein
MGQVDNCADITEMLRTAGIEDPLTDEERFLATCMRGEKASVAAIQERLPDIFSRLSRNNCNLSLSRLTSAMQA